jgi:predicted amidophosphoribosyltransferase
MAAMAGLGELGLAAPRASLARPRARGRFGLLLDRIADLVLPPVCISCRRRVGGHGLLCGDCFARIDFIAPPICARLGIPLPYDAGEGSLSAAAIASPPVYDRARAAARYSDTMRELIQSFKYRDRHEGLPLFARWLVKAGRELLADADLIVPVPLYPSRLWWRRFNQSAMLAQGLGRLTGIPVDCFVLKRVRRTSTRSG